MAETMNAYVYAIVVDGVVRYIGKGSGRRVKNHMQRVRNILRRRAGGEKVRTSKFYNRLTKASIGGSVIQELIIADGLTDDAAYERERAEIAAAPDGQLWNLWDGGAGGARALPELRAELSKIAKQRYSDPEEREKHRQIMLAVAADPRVRAKRRATIDVKWRDPEFRKRQIATLQASLNVPAVRAKQSASAKVINSKPERREKMSKDSRKMWADPEHHAAHCEALKDAWARPDTRAKHRAYLDSPEGRAKLKAASAVRWAKHRARVSQETTS